MILSENRYPLFRIMPWFAEPNRGRGRSHARQSNRIKEAGALSKQEGRLRSRQCGLQPIDIPGKFVAAGGRRGGLWGGSAMARLGTRSRLARMSKTTPATKALQKLGVKFALHTYVYDSSAA